MATKVEFGINSVVRAIRIQNLIILGLAQYFTATFLSGPGNYSFLDIVSNLQLLVLSLSTISIAAAGYIINDYYDIKIDYVNRPEKVVVGKDISRRKALILHSGFNFLGIALGLSISIWIGFVDFLAAGLLWLYSNQLKRLPFVGNLTVSMLSGLAILLVAFIYQESIVMIALYAFFALFFSLIREIVKDIEDLSGDQKFGCKTLPIVWGVRKTKNLLYLLLVIFLISFSFISYQYLGRQWWLMATVLLFVELLFVWKLRFADTKRDFRNLSFYCKIILILGVFSMALL